MPTVDLRTARWRKSSWSNNGGNSNCVEVALLDADWRKSSWSDNGGNSNCVEVAFTGQAAAIRDSKNPNGPTLLLPGDRFHALLSTLHAG